MNATRLLSEGVAIKKLRNPETVLATGVYAPTSGNFINVGDYDRFAFLIECGALAHQQTFQVRQATAVNGSPKDVTGAVVIVPADGDSKWYLIEVAGEQLDVNNGYHFVTLLNTGGGTGDYAEITFLGLVPGMRPTVQGTDLGEIVNLVG